MDGAQGGFRVEPAGGNMPKPLNEGRAWRPARRGPGRTDALARGGGAAARRPRRSPGPPGLRARQGCRYGRGGGTPPQQRPKNRKGRGAAEPQEAASRRPDAACPQSGGREPPRGDRPVPFLPFDLGPVQPFPVPFLPAAMDGRSRPHGGQERRGVRWNGAQKIRAGGVLVAKRVDCESGLSRGGGGRAVRSGVG